MLLAWLAAAVVTLGGADVRVSGELLHGADVGAPASSNSPTNERRRSCGEKLEVLGDGALFGGDGSGVVSNHPR